MNGGDNSLIAGGISAVALVGTNWLVGLITDRSKRMEGLVEGDRRFSFTTASSSRK